MRIKKLFTTLVLMALLLVWAGLGQAKTTTWKLGFGAGPNDPEYPIVDAFIKKVDAYSEGQFKINILLTQPLGYGKDGILRFMKQGLAECGLVVPNYLHKADPMFGLLLPQGLLVEKQDNVKLIDVMKETLEKIYNKWGVTLQAPVWNGVMVDWVLISKEPINTLEQMKGKKIRHSDKMVLKALNNLGISAQYVSTTDTYMSLRTGVIDGAVYGRLWVLKQSLNEVTGYSSRMGPYSAAVMPGIGVSQKAWAKLPDDMKAVFKRAAKEVFWDSMLEKWETEFYEKYSIAELSKAEKPMKEIEPFPRQDLLTLQKEIIKVWQEESEKKGPEAVEHCKKVISIITKE